MLSSLFCHRNLFGRPNMDPWRREIFQRFNIRIDFCTNQKRLLLSIITDVYAVSLLRVVILKLNYPSNFFALDITTDESDHHRNGPNRVLRFFDSNICVYCDSIPSVFASVFVLIKWYCGSNSINETNV